MMLWLRRGFKQDSGKRVSLFIVLREYHLMKGPDNEAIFSVVCVSDILEQHNIIKRLWHIFELWFLQTIWLRNDVMRLCRHFHSNADSCYRGFSCDVRRSRDFLVYSILEVKPPVPGHFRNADHSCWYVCQTAWITVWCFVCQCIVGCLANSYNIMS